MELVRLVVSKYLLCSVLASGPPPKKGGVIAYPEDPKSNWSTAHIQGAPRDPLAGTAQGQREWVYPKWDPSLPYPRGITKREGKGPTCEYLYFKYLLVPAYSPGH